MATSIREQLHRLIDRLPDTELGAAKRYLESLPAAKGIPDVLAEAAEEAEPPSPREAAALAEADAQVGRGELVPDADFDLALARSRDRRQRRP